MDGLVREMGGKWPSKKDGCLVQGDRYSALLATAALWVRIETSLKNTKWAT